MDAFYRGMQVPAPSRRADEYTYSPSQDGDIHDDRAAHPQHRAIQRSEPRLTKRLNLKASESDEPPVSLTARSTCSPARYHCAKPDAHPQSCKIRKFRDDALASNILDTTVLHAPGAVSMTRVCQTVRFAVAYCN